MHDFLIHQKAAGAHSNGKQTFPRKSGQNATERKYTDLAALWRLQGFGV